MFVAGCDELVFTLSRVVIGHDVDNAMVSHVYLAFLTSLTYLPDQVLSIVGGRVSARLEYGLLKVWDYPDAAPEDPPLAVFQLNPYAAVLLLEESVPDTEPNRQSVRSNGHSHSERS